MLCFVLFVYIDLFNNIVVVVVLSVSELNYVFSCSKVFDMHDNNECGGVQWQSSKYSEYENLYCRLNLVAY